MTSPDPKFTALHRSAAELMTHVKERTPDVGWVEAPQLTWGQIRDKISAQCDWMVFPRPTELRCGAGVPDWLKSILPTIKDSDSPFGAARYAGVRVVEVDDLPPGHYAVMDQYGAPMLEGEVPA